MKKFLLSIIVLVAGFSTTFASHNRAGEITYKYVGDAAHPYKYHITVTTYTKWIDDHSVDNCQLTVNFGDGDSAVVYRDNGTTDTLCAGIPDGVLISTAANTKKNIYEVDHNYAGPGNFMIWMANQARNADICNIPDSKDQYFFLQSELVIDPFLGPNDSPVLTFPPIDNACVGYCFEHNPGAYDDNGDSLYYSLSPSYTRSDVLFPAGITIPLWTYPPNMNASSINPYTGLLDWCVPTMICQYNVAILIQQYRLVKGAGTRTWYYIGSVLRDMQITVGNCSDNAPLINHLNDTCIIAGTNLNFHVSATDLDSNSLSLTANGGPFIVSPAATFTSSSIMGTPSTAGGIFNWTPDCSEVQLLPYMVTFKVSDGVGPTPLVNFESVFIKVIAPAPTGLTATPSGASIILNWTAPACGATGPNPLVKYYIYRKNSCETWIPGTCETGVPSYTGYSLIGSTLPGTLTFTDNNGGVGLVNGIDYSYIVIAVYLDGSQSVASQHICAKLVRDVPIITNVSVMTTGTTGSGSIWTHWIKPLATSPNLDTIANPAPYKCILMKANGQTGTLTFNQVAAYTYAAYWQITDTGFVNTGLNTQDSAYTYRVDFYSNGILKGSTNTASSVFLSSTPADKKVNLTWQQFVPWVNYKYYIYRETTTPGVFALHDSTYTTAYTDTALADEVQYCYKILSVGQYSDTTLPKPLFNFSQIKCETPVDLVPPCQPSFNVATDCDILQNVITWVNPNTYCCHDAVQYNIYFAPTVNDPLQIIYSSNDMSTTTYTLPVYYFDGVASIAGCYAVTAVDSALHPNESPIVNKICIDNCPLYELPNVFTPNNDGTNDFFTPLPGYRYVKDIDIKIYDRWGLLMFSTTNPDIKWDGTDKESKKLCVDGTYFYTCIVNEIHVDGIKPRLLKGFVQLIQDKTKPAY